LVEEAFERAGSELRTGYDLRTARRSLNLLFADWANRGVNMWTFEQGTMKKLEEFIVEEENKKDPRWNELKKLINDN
jgi:hypothetical protein